jgi:CRISPR-associated protein Cas1
MNYAIYNIGVKNMGEKFYIFKNGVLSRKDNNIRMTTKEGDIKDIKSEVVDEIFLFGEIDINTKLLNFLSQKGIILHIFNYYGFYSGSYYPKETNVSGYLVVNQVRHYIDETLRLSIAKEILKTASANIYRNLRYYNSRGSELDDFLTEIDSLSKKLDFASSINQLMGIEGNIRKKYYSAWNIIINQDIEFTKRTKRPPDNMINSLISFANSLIYTTTLSEIYKTQLNPTISYLHEPGEKRFSLSLDISEIFKPLIADRMIFSLLNKNKITIDDFDEESNFTYLKENSRKKIIEDYDIRLERTIFHKELNRDVSYRYLIRLECYKIIKHLIGEKEYSGFRIWW